MRSNFKSLLDLKKTLTVSMLTGQKMVKFSDTYEIILPVLRRDTTVRRERQAEAEAQKIIDNLFK